jgi:hypothetical protein
LFTLTTFIALTLAWQSAPGALQSVYTSLAAPDCKTVSTNEEGARSTQRCPGAGGYALLVEDADSRMSVTVVAPDGKKHDLRYWQVVTTAFSEIGRKAEWRVKRQGRRDVPVALIVRLNASEDGEHPEKKTSYLVVAKVTPQQVCVTDRIAPAADANEQARSAADTASSRPCVEAQE